jgi:hypothetical protein
MPTLNINFNEVPDRVPNITPGIYTLRIDEPPTIEPQSKHPEKSNLVVKFRIDDEGEWKDRQLTNYIGTDRHVDIKRLALACGVTISDKGLATEDFIGKRCKAVINLRSYLDKDSNEMKETSNIKEFLIQK